VKVPRWIVGCIFIAGGVMSRIVFSIYAHPESGYPELTLCLVGWFGVGLVLLAVPLVRESYKPTEPTRGEIGGWLIWSITALFAFLLIISTLRP
jgi:hypothetical protein